jgi:hypothetical protein
MPLRLLLPFFLFFVSADIFSQVPDTARKGIHQVESEYYNSIMKGVPAEEEKGTAFPSDLMMRETGLLPRMVLGWHPYWASSTAHQYYDYNVLSPISAMRSIQQQVVIRLSTAGIQLRLLTMPTFEAQKCFLQSPISDHQGIQSS